MTGFPTTTQEQSETISQATTTPEAIETTTTELTSIRTTSPATTTDEQSERTSQAATTLATVRLVGGPSSNEGRVEVFYNGVWGTVCDDLWDDVDAGVVCRSLGMGDTGTAFSNAAFGQGTGYIILDNVACNGDETDLFDCANNGPKMHNCWHGEDAGVGCTSTTSTTSIRLANGSSSSEGRVEVFYGGEWGTVCDDGWDLTDANVVCQSLGFDSALEAVSYAGFGEGTGAILLDDVDCSGSETSIFDCGNVGIGFHNCKHEEDAGVRCFQSTADTVCRSISLTSEGSRYNFSTCKVNHTSAISDCSQHGSHLVYIGTQEEQQFIMDNIGDSRRYYWIGLTREPTKWLDGSSLTYDNIAYGKWAFNRGGECFRIRMNDGRWYDRECSWEYRYICEKEIGAACGPHFLPFNGHGDGSCYNFSTSKVDHGSAVLACSQHGSHLVYIGSQEEQDFIRRNTKDSNEDYWIGLTREPATWLDGSNITYDRTVSTSFDQGGDCFILYDWPWGKWHDEDCSSEYRYICEKESDD